MLMAFRWCINKVCIVFIVSYCIVVLFCIDVNKRSALECSGAKPYAGLWTVKIKTVYKYRVKRTKSLLSNTRSYKLLNRRSWWKKKIKTHELLTIIILVVLRFSVKAADDLEVDRKTNCECWCVIPGRSFALSLENKSGRSQLKAVLPADLRQPGLARVWTGGLHSEKERLFFVSKDAKPPLKAD